VRDLIDALLILAKYADLHALSATRCTTDMMIVAVNPVTVSKTDIASLHDLGFLADVTSAHFFSYRHGSC
jgi:hypothetical protein